MIEQTLVHMPDLLDVEIAIAESSGLGDSAYLEREHLNGVENRQHRAVVHGQRSSRGVRPRLAGTPPFEEGVTVRIEERPTVCRQPKAVMRNATLNPAERGEQSMPRGVPFFEGVERVSRRFGFELLAQRRHGIVRCVQLVVGRQQPSLFG